MGMYTEFWFRAEFAQNAPEDVKKIVQTMIEAPQFLEYLQVPDHEFFKCSRWGMVGTCGSYYFPQAGQSEWRIERSQRLTEFAIHSSLKDYSNEIEKFVDWIKPYLNTNGKPFLGYSLYEESDTPTMFYLYRDE